MREHRKRVHENKANSASAGPSGTSGVAGLAMDGAADDDDAAKDGLDLGGISEWED